MYVLHPARLLATDQTVGRSITSRMSTQHLNKQCSVSTTEAHHLPAPNAGTLIYQQLTDGKLKAGETMQSLSDRLMVSIDFVKRLSYSCFFRFILYFVFFPRPLGKVLMNFIKILRH